MVYCMQAPVPCDLAVSNPMFRIVARGMLIPCKPREPVHNVPLHPDHVKVKINVVADGEENDPLSVPFFGHGQAREAIGTWAQWLKNQVILSKMFRSIKSYNDGDINEI